MFSARPSASEAAARLLDNYSIEVNPGHEAGFNPTSAQLPQGSDVFIGHLPGTPVAGIVRAARHLREKGFNPVPHMAARNFESVQDFAGLAEQLAALDVMSVLLLGGGHADPVGPFQEASQLLEHGVLQANGFQSVHFAGHPEGHPVAATQLIEECLRRKIDRARTSGLRPGIVTQFGFDGTRYADWAAGLRSAGVDVPIAFGVAGVTTFSKLVRYAAFCGVGASINALRAKKFGLLRLLGPITPADVIEPLAARLSELGVEGVRIHFFNFGAHTDTLDWAVEAARSQNGEVARSQRAGLDQ